MKDKRLIRVSIKGVSEEDYENYRRCMEFNIHKIFFHIEEKSKVDPDFKNGEVCVWPILIEDLHYRSVFEQGIVYTMKEGKIIVTLGFEIRRGILSGIYREFEEIRDRIDRIKTISANIFQGLVDGLRKRDIGIEAEVHMSFDSYSFSIQEEASNDVRQKHEG